MNSVLMVKDGGEIISIVRLKEEFTASYLVYLSKQVAQDFNKYVKENWDTNNYEFDELYNIIGKYEEIEDIEVVNSFIIDLDREV